MLRTVTRGAVCQPKSTGCACSRTGGRPYSASSLTSKSRTKSQNRSTIVAGTCLAVLSASAYIGWRQTIYSDAAATIPASADVNEKRPGRTVSGTPDALEDDDHLRILVWGSNKSNLLAPDDPSIDSFRTPYITSLLHDVALRDLVLHERHGACVDARGDVYQWGDAYFGEAEGDGNKPEVTLQGKDIVSVQASAARVFALSASGRVYALPAARNLNQTKVASSSGWSWLGFGNSSKNCEAIEIMPKQVLGRRERFMSISAGQDHLIALTSLGRTYAIPLSVNANSHGQLGFRRFDVSISDNGKDRLNVELKPKAVADPYANVTAAERALTSNEPLQSRAKALSEEVLTTGGTFSVYCDHLYEVPALRGVKVAQAVAGARSSYVRTEGEGRVLAWGANEYGQLGLGANMTIDTITIPTEVIFTRAASGGRVGRCVGIVSGGDLAFFLLERFNGAHAIMDLLSCGMGQWGALGNGLYTTSQGTPTKIRAVSGLLEYCESAQSLQPITPHAMTVSPSGHVLLTLDTFARAGPNITNSKTQTSAIGRDLLVWGLNRDYQLGNGKRASSAIPSTVEDVSLSSAARFVAASNFGDKSQPNADVKISRRLMLRTRKADVRDMSGKLWKSGIQVEQTAVAGYGSSLVYWKIC